MGLIQSKQEISPTVSSNQRQILNTFRQETPILLRRHNTTSKTDLSKLPEGSEKKLVHQRSRSFDRNENKNIQINSPLIKRKWQCQLCQTFNETDSQLCSDCGTSKINIYIPIMNQNQTSEK